MGNHAWRMGELQLSQYIRASHQWVARTSRQRPGGHQYKLLRTDSSSGEFDNGAELQTSLQELCRRGTSFTGVPQYQSFLLLGLWSPRNADSRMLSSYQSGKREQSSPSRGVVGDSREESPALGNILQSQASRIIAQVRVEGRLFKAAIDTGQQKFCEQTSRPTRRNTT